MPRAPVAAWANDCEEAPDIPQPDSARAGLLRTLADEARAEETCVENALLEFAAVTLPKVFALAAEALAAELEALGALRAELPEDIQAAYAECPIQAYCSNTQPVAGDSRLTSGGLRTYSLAGPGLE